MPYIKKIDRRKFDPFIEDLEKSLYSEDMTPGELNYVITKLMHLYIDNKGLNYTHINDVVGVLECAKAEFQRRVVANYEKEKIKENGDL